MEDEDDRQKNTDLCQKLLAPLRPNSSNLHPSFIHSRMKPGPPYGAPETVTTPIYDGPRSPVGQTHATTCG